MLDDARETLTDQQEPDRHPRVCDSQRGEPDGESAQSGSASIYEEMQDAKEFKGDNCGSCGESRCFQAYHDQ